MSAKAAEDFRRMGEGAGEPPWPAAWLSRYNVAWSAMTPDEQQDALDEAWLRCTEGQEAEPEP